MYPNDFSSGISQQNIEKKGDKKDPIPLPEVTVTAKGYSPIGRFLRRLWRAINNGGNNTYQKPYGEPWTSEDGQGQENSTAKIQGPGGNIDLLLSVDPNAGRLELPGTGIERVNAALEKASEAVQEGTPDKQITEQSTGIAEKTDAHGQQIKKTEKNDTIIAPDNNFLYRYEDEKGWPPRFRYAKFHDTLIHYNYYKSGIFKDISK